MHKFPEAVMITIRQCKAARALLGWNQDRLAERTGISVSALARWERAYSRAAKYETLRDIKLALEHEGIRFIGETGVDRPEKT